MQQTKKEALPVSALVLVSIQRFDHLSCLLLVMRSSAPTPLKGDIGSLHPDPRLPGPEGSAVTFFRMAALYKLDDLLLLKTSYSTSTAVAVLSELIHGVRETSAQSKLAG